MNNRPSAIEHPPLAISNPPARPRPGEAARPYANPHHPDRPSDSPQNRPLPPMPDLKKPTMRTETVPDLYSSKPRDNRYGGPRCNPPVRGESEKSKVLSVWRGLITVSLLATSIVGCSQPQDSPHYWLAKAEAELPAIEAKGKAAAVILRLAMTKIRVEGAQSVSAFVDKQQDHILRARLRLILTAHYAEKGDFDAAEHEAAAISAQGDPNDRDSSDTRDRAYKAIAVQSARAGDMDKAIAALSEITPAGSPPNNRRWSTYYLGVMLCKLGRCSDAHRVVSLLSRPEDRKEFESSLMALDVIRDAKDARAAVSVLRRKLTEPDQLRIRIYVGALASSFGGRAKMAGGLVDLLESPTSRMEAAAKAASALHRRGQSADALELINIVRDEKAESYCHVCLAQAYAELGKQAEAVALVKEIDFGKLDSDEAFLALRYASSHLRALDILLAAGEVEAARRLVVAAGKAAALIRMVASDKSIEFSTIDRFANFWARQGTPQQLEAFLQGCKTPCRRAMAYCGIAEAKAGIVKTLAMIPEL